MLRYRANEVVRLAEKYREQWSDRPDAYWLMRLMQEVGELASVLAGDHDDTVEHELRQVASIALNWLRRIPITVAPGNAWSSRPTTPVEEEDDGR